MIYGCSRKKNIHNSSKHISRAGKKPHFIRRKDSLLNFFFLLNLNFFKENIYIQNIQSIKYILGLLSLIF